jgi:amino acid transporter
MKQKIKQILAIIGIIVLVGMYVLTIIAAIFDNPKTMTFLGISVVLTVMIPIIIYFILYLLRGGDDDAATKALKGAEEDKKHKKDN